MKKYMMISAILFSTVMSTMTSCSMVPAVPPTPENTVEVGTTVMQIGANYTYSFTVTIGDDKSESHIGTELGATILDVYTGGFVTVAELHFNDEVGRKVQDDINKKIDQLYDAGWSGYIYTFSGICQPDEDGMIWAKTWYPF